MFTKTEVCKRGHERTEENTIMDRGRRRCRVCRNARHKMYRKGLKASDLLQPVVVGAVAGAVAFVENV